MTTTCDDIAELPRRACSPRSPAAAQAEGKIRIVDTLSTELPMPPFTEPETNALADRIYCVWARTTAEPAWMAA